MSQIYKRGGGSPAGDVETLTGDTGGAVGPDAAFNINVLGQPDINVAGNAGTNTLTWTDLTKITPYVVNNTLTAGTQVAYSTIQSAINAANLAGGGDVYIQRGAYTENLTLRDQVNLIAVPGISQGVSAGVTITGTHIPPPTGQVLMNGIAFFSTTDVLNSAVAGSAHVTFANCESAVQNGYLVNLPNWTGTIEIYDNNPVTASAPWAINDGCVFNTGGSPVILYNTGAGSGTNVMTVSGSSFFGQAVGVGCPLTLVTGANVISVGSQYNGTVTLSNNSVFSSYNDSFVTGATQALTMDSSANSSIATATIQSTNNPAIGGTGAGSLTLLNNAFVDNQQIGASVITPNLTHLVRGTGQTVNVGTADLITYTLRDVASAYQFNALISGISVGGSAIGVELSGIIKSNGAASSIVGTVDQTFNAELAIAGASIAVVPVGNTLIIRATGSLGSVINWSIDLTFKQKTN